METYTFILLMKTVHIFQDKLKPGIIPEVDSAQIAFPAQNFQQKDPI